MSERDWTQDHYVTRNSTTDDPSGYRVWLTCRCGWNSGTLPDGNLPTTHRAELEHYVSGAPAEPAVTERETEGDAVTEAFDRWPLVQGQESALYAWATAKRSGFVEGAKWAFRSGAPAEPARQDFMPGVIEALDNLTIRKGE